VSVSGAGAGVWSSAVRYIDFPQLLGRIAALFANLHWACVRPERDWWLPRSVTGSLRLRAGSPDGAGLKNRTPLKSLTIERAD